MGSNGTHALVDTAIALNYTGRNHMTVWRSEDSGGSYPAKQLVDEGSAGYSSLAYLGEGAR